MKKKKQIKDGNVIQFPGTSGHLEKEGQTALEEKRFDDAIRLYREALRFETDHAEEMKMALLIAYHESGNHDEGIQLSRDMLHTGEGQYFDVLDLHVLMLIQKKRYQEVADTLSALLEEGLPPDRYEHFAHLKALADRMSVKQHEPKTALFKNDDTMQDKIMKLAELASLDASPYEKELIAVLADNSEHPFVQSMSLGLLREIGTAQSVTVRKFYFEKDVIPVLMDEAFSRPFFKETAAHLDKTIGQENPVLFEQAIELIKQQSFLMHPFDPEVEPSVWAIAAVLHIESLYRPVNDLLNIDPEVEEALSFMKELDEISAF
jgi:tetratricopeptide (TPR) repeat protein